MEEEDTEAQRHQHSNGGNHPTPSVLVIIKGISHGRTEGAKTVEIRDSSRRAPESPSDRSRSDRAEEETTCVPPRSASRFSDLGQFRLICVNSLNFAPPVPMILLVPWMGSG